MKNGFHLTKTGPKACTASVRNCPIGGAHFETKAEAAQAYEFKADKKFSPLGALKKKINPFTSHVAAADKRIQDLEDEMLDRDARQGNGTLYKALLAEGFTDDELDQRFKEETSTRQSTISFTKNADGEPNVVGLTYGGDYKAEEEWGMAAITKGLEDGSYGPDDVLLYTRGDTTVLAIRGEDSYTWSPNPKENKAVLLAERSARGRHNSYLPHDQQQLIWSLRRKSVAYLRAELKGKVVPLPKTRAELEKAVANLRNPEPYRVPAMGEFQRGDALVIVTSDPLEAKLMTKLKDSHTNKSLRVGNSSNPFSRGALFYDDRDLSRARKSELIRDEEVTKAAEAYISETSAELASKGGIHSLMPGISSEAKDIREAKFFLNYSPKESKEQIYGWFDKNQLDRIAKGDYSDIPERNK